MTRMNLPKKNIGYDRKNHDCRQYLVHETLNEAYCDICKKKFDTRFYPPKEVQK